MSRPPVLLFADDDDQELLSALVAGGGRRALSGEPARVAVAAGERSLASLARLVVERPKVARIVVLPATASSEIVAATVAATQPFRIVLGAEALAAALRAAFAVEHSAPSAPDTPLIDYANLRARLAVEEERARRYRRPLALVLIDIDGLGALADERGASAAELAARQVGAALFAGARAVDIVGAVAGGCFALVLPETTAGQAFGTTDRLRADVAARPVPVGERTQARVTVSCGVAAVSDGPRSAWTRALEALARAKSAGGNRSVVDGG
jgi:diguanylate cyclase (GGDEF)-like protein